MSLKEKMCRVKGLPTSISAYLYASLMFTGLPNHFPLLTMDKRFKVLYKFVNFDNSVSRSRSQMGNCSGKFVML